MNVYDAVRTKLDVREFSTRKTSDSIKVKVLEAARLTQSGNNLQHWRFILVDSKDGLERLAQDSTTGKWVSKADFAVIVLTDPKYNFHKLDAGRVTQSMELAAWGEGVASGIFTGINEEKLRKDFGIPENLQASVVVGFGYPTKKLLGRKSRKPLSEIAFHHKYGEKLDIIER